MKAIVITEPGGPEKLNIVDRPDPTPRPGHVVIEVKAFGVNHAEAHMRRGEWPEMSEISGIECAGIVNADSTGRLAIGQTVVALMGGMGRSISGSYAEYTQVPATNVVPVDTTLPWSVLAAVPESYATAWACLFGNLELQAGQTLVIRGATSALGRAALDIAAQAGANVIATTRSPARFTALEALGARGTMLESPELSDQVRARHPEGVDAVLDLVGNTVVLDSLKMVRVRGRVCEAGWLGGLGPIESFNPVMQLPSRVHFSLFASFVFGTPGFPLSEVPFQSIVDRVADGSYRAAPVRTFAFDEIREAHRLLDSGTANGKIVVTVP